MVLLLDGDGKIIDGRNTSPDAFKPAWNAVDSTMLLFNQLVRIAEVINPTTEYVPGWYSDYRVKLDDSDVVEEKEQLMYMSLRQMQQEQLTTLVAGVARLAKPEYLPI
jgi:hypothetical protein